MAAKVAHACVDVATLDVRLILAALREFREAHRDQVLGTMAGGHTDEVIGFFSDVLESMSEAERVSVPV